MDTLQIIKNRKSVRVFEEKEISDEVKKSIIDAAMIVYGYPTKQQLERTKPVRFEKEYIVYENSYKNFTREEHINFHEVRAKKSNSQKTASEIIKAICDKKYMTDFSLEMSRSARKYIEKFMR